MLIRQQRKNDNKYTVQIAKLYRGSRLSTQVRNYVVMRGIRQKCHQISHWALLRDRALQQGNAGRSAAMHHEARSMLASQTAKAAHLCKKACPCNHGEAAILYLFHFVVFERGHVLAQAERVEQDATCSSSSLKVGNAMPHLSHLLTSTAAVGNAMPHLSRLRPQCCKTKLSLLPG